MLNGSASRTAEGVAIHRTEHQVYDRPQVFSDPIAPRIIGPKGNVAITLRALTAHLPSSRYLRAFIAARSRYAEDQLARAIMAGTRQYVVLGAGLDTFAYRCPYPEQELRTYEVDHPDTQAMKLRRLEQTGIHVPAAVTFVPIDFERQSLRIELERAGFEPTQSAFFSWLGGTPYLERGTVMAMFSLIHDLCPDNTVAFDYARPRQALSGPEKLAVEVMDARVRRAGEPFRSFFNPEELAAELRKLGFRRVESPTTDQINALYFRNRWDGLQVRGRLGGLMCAY